MVQSLQEIFWQFLIKQNIILPYDATITLLGIYAMNLRTCVHIQSYISVFIATLFITTKTYKQPRCFSVGEWKNCGISKQ